MRWFALVVLLGCKGSPSKAPVVLDAPAVAIDAAMPIDAMPIDAMPIDAPIDAMPIDAGTRTKPRAKPSRTRCLEECRRRNMSRHCMDADGMTDCPCNCK